jgi:hypothetical protein
MYDEAFNKALRVFEMAIKQKCLQVGITIKTVKNNHKNLDSFIKEICQINELSELSYILYRFKQLRNMHMHPNEHTYMGIIGMLPSNIKLIIIYINRLFQSLQWHKDNTNNRNLIENKIKEFKEFPITIGSGNPLFSKIDHFEVFENFLIFLLEPIPLIVIESIKNHHMIPHFTFQLNEFKITANGFEGVDLNGNFQSLTQSINPKDIEVLENYNLELHKISEKELDSFQLNKQNKWEVVDWEYEIIKSIYTK